MVMGGKNKMRGNFNSVECFTMGGSAWEYLPAMNKTRFRAVAEALPAIKKYVLKQSLKFFPDCLIHIVI